MTLALAITGILVIATVAINMMADDEARKSADLLEEIETWQKARRR